MEGPRSWGRQLCPRQLHCQKMLCYSWTRVLGRVRLCDVWSSSHSMLRFQAQETLSHLMTILSFWSWEPSPGTMWQAGEATRRDQLLQNSVHTDLIRSIPGGPGGKCPRLGDPSPGARPQAPSCSEACHHFICSQLKTFLFNKSVMSLVRVVLKVLSN